jgi:hypothetical protein
VAPVEAVEVAEVEERTEPAAGVAAVPERPKTTQRVQPEAEEVVAPLAAEEVEPPKLVAVPAQVVGRVAALLRQEDGCADRRADRGWPRLEV